MYRCGTCGSTVILVRSIAGGPWQVTCGLGHVWIPIPSTDIEMIIRTEEKEVVFFFDPYNN